MSFIVVMKPCKESNRGRLTLQGVQDHFEAKKNGQNSEACFLHIFIYLFTKLLKVVFWNSAIPLSKKIVSDTLYYSNRHYKMSSTYKIHLPNGKSWLTLQKRGNSNIISSVLHYFP